MPTLFLSHTSIDKPFVEKLARDLNRLGIRVWYDKYEIKVGESIFWRVDEGLSSSEYFGIVLSPEALGSEWVKSELSSAWFKKMACNSNQILPLLYRACELPVLLRPIKYADFRTDYQRGLSELALVFGIKSTEAITSDNWRCFVRVPNSDWRDYRESEFKELVTALCKITEERNFSIYTGGSARPFSVAISSPSFKNRMGFCIRMDPKKGYRYMCSEGDENPNHVPLSSFDRYAGSTVNEALEFVCSRLDSYEKEFGRPVGKRFAQTTRMDRLMGDWPVELTRTMLRQVDWNQDVL